MEVFVRYPVNLSLLDVAAHNPSYHELMASMPAGSERIVDYCVPVNSYFPTPAMFVDMHEAMLDAVKYYPESAERLGRRLASRLAIDPSELVLANGSTELIGTSEVKFWRDQMDALGWGHVGATNIVVGSTSVIMEGGGALSKIESEYSQVFTTKGAATSNMIEEMNLGIDE